MYVKIANKVCISAWLFLVRSTFDRSRLLGDIDNLVNLFCNRFDMAVVSATPLVLLLLVSMLDPKQRV